MFIRSDDLKCFVTQCKGCVYSAGVSGVIVVTQSPIITVSKGRGADGTGDGGDMTPPDS